MARPAPPRRPTTSPAPPPAPGCRPSAPPRVLDGDPARANPTLAAAAARTYLDAAGVTGTVAIAPGGQRLTVATRDTYTPVLLSAIGIGPMPVTGQATADLVTVEGGTP